MHTHKTSRIGLVSPDLSIYQNLTLHQNSNDFTVNQSILQPVTQDKNKWQTLPSLVRSRGWFGCLHESKHNTSGKQIWRMNLRIHDKQNASSIMKTLHTNAPPNLSSIQCLGALSLFICFFKPLACRNRLLISKLLFQISKAHIPKLDN